MVDSLVKICEILGVDYSELDSFDDNCKKIDYLLDCILQALGGK